VLKRLAQENGLDIGGILGVAGDVFSMEVGSTIGVLFGSALTEAGRAMGGKKTLDTEGFATVLKEILAGVKAVGGASAGDKTLIDALEPAAKAALVAAQQKMGIAQALVEAATAAEAGSSSTVDMVAKVGRSSYLGERSRGHVDPGAAFIAFFLRSMSSSIEPSPDGTGVSG